MRSGIPVTDRLAAFGRFVRAELASYPGRMTWALRLLCTSLIVVLISMTLQIPMVTLSVAVIVFYGLQPNAVVTRLLGVVFLVGTLLEIGTVVLVLKFTYDYPFVRIVVSSLIFFVCMYLMRVHKAGLLFFAIGAVLVYGQTTADTLDFPELALRAMLWSAASCLYPVAVLWLVNLFLFPLEQPSQQWRVEMHRQLAGVMERLRDVGNGEGSAAPRSGETIDKAALTLQKLHGLVAMEDKNYRAAKAYWSSSIEVVAYLCAVSNALPVTAVASSDEGRSFLGKLGEEIRMLDASFAALQPYRSGWCLSSREWEMAQGMGLGGFCRALQALASTDPLPPEASPPAKGGMFVPDAFSNPAYVRFALKALLASLICYVFYHAVQWDGIHTSMITCALVANPNLGATSEKIGLRIGGALLGGFLALVLSLVVLPHIDGIVGLLLAIAPVFLLGGWIAAGSERTSYIGVQMVATFCLGFMEHFGPVNDLTEIRDRTVGILLGAVVSGLMYTWVWPESEAGTLRRKLADMAGTLGRLVARPVQHDDRSWLGYLRQRMACVNLLEASRDMRRRVSLEGHLEEGERRMLLQRAERMLTQGQRILGASDVLCADDPGAGVADQSLLAWQAKAGDWLCRYGDGLAASVEGDANGFPARALDKPAGASPHMAQARQLAEDINGLPDWIDAPA